MVVVIVIVLLVEEVRLNLQDSVKIKGAAIEQACNINITPLRPDDARDRIDPADTLFDCR